MHFYRKPENEKMGFLNRCHFDAEQGWMSLSLARLADLKIEFQNDPQGIYAEAIIRKDFLGEGIKAQVLFLKAHQLSSQNSGHEETYCLSTFNSAAFARTIEEYRHQEDIFRNHFPNDPDIILFDQINRDLEQGMQYVDILAQRVIMHEQNKQHGNCAALAEIALQAEEHSLRNESALRQGRLQALRELDKIAANSRIVRGEGIPPKERLALHGALEELEKALSLEPEAHILWNLKSSFLCLLEQFEEAIKAADQSLRLCPTGYLKPRVNKALAMFKCGRKKEAMQEASEVIHLAKTIGNEAKNDSALAKGMINDFSLPSASDDEMLADLAKTLCIGASLTADKQINPKDQKKVLNGLKRRIGMIGSAWSQDYIAFTAELLSDFDSGTVWKLMTQISNSHLKPSIHCVHAAIYIAVHAEGVMRRDACRFLIYFLLGTSEPQRIRGKYRSGILGPTAVGEGQFKHLQGFICEEMERINPLLLRLIDEQPSLHWQELDYAANITMSRFKLGIDRDPEPQKSASINGFINRIIKIFSVSK